MTKDRTVFPVKRALISAYDKTGVALFARTLASMGVEILSTGGTAELLRREGLPVTDVSHVTKFPEMLDGRVKTLHPNLHAGLLALRENPAHMRTLEEHRIAPIDLVAVSLYPFAQALASGKPEPEVIEMIDIGGPSMLRSAAKNFRYVAALSDPADYDPVCRELSENGGALSLETRRRLAAKVFRLTAGYDALIAGFFSAEGDPEAGTRLPGAFSPQFRKASDLRYGENPHQKGALYREEGAAPGLADARQLHGKELSFNNILDLDAAFEMVEAFAEPACAVVKHTSPCGFALGKDTASAFKRAHACDPLSAFGGIVGFNNEVDAKAARAVLAAGFLECVIARSFTKEALGLLTAKKNLRLLTLEPSGRHRKDGGPEASRDWDYKKVKGGLLLQDRDRLDPGPQDLRVVTKAKPRASEIRDLLFAFRMCRYVKSNGIVIAKGGTTLGLGMGQPSRVDACMTAFRKAGARARGAVLASDGFFPKPDSIALARRHGIRAIAQPGGSIQDEAVIAACDRAGIAMVFTGVRHFKH